MYVRLYVCPSLHIKKFQDWKDSKAILGAFTESATPQLWHSICLSVHLSLDISHTFSTKFNARSDAVRTHQCFVGLVQSASHWLNQSVRHDSNMVIRPKSRASADEQTKTFKKTFALATKSLKNNFVANQWTDRRTNGRTDRQTDKKVAYRGVWMT